MLQRSTQSSLLEDSPDVDLGSTAGVLAPLGEPISVQSHVLLPLSNGILILEEEDRAGSSTEALESLRALLEAVGGSDGSESAVHRLGPVVVVGLTEEDELFSGGRR